MRNFIFIILNMILFLLSCENNKKGNFKFNNEKFIQGKVIGIYDGDTYSLLTIDNNTLKIRMEGIDAPEREMPYHTASRKKLSELIYKKTVYFDKTGEDVHGRSLGFTFLENGIDVDIEMLKAGMVWHFKRYNDNPDYANAEDAARKQKVGLWKEEDPIAPWTYRRNNRNNF
jgi:endonuclease YncB( thermonuclease family)